jgi:hypothetical protein
MNNLSQDEAGGGAAHQHGDQMLRQPDPEPTHDWEVYSIRNSPAQLVGWVQAATAEEACREMAEVSGNDVKRLIAVRRL